MKFNFPKIYLLLIFIYVSSCKNDDGGISPTETSLSPDLDTYPTALATDWQDLHLELIKTTAGYAPPIAARSLAYVNLGLYESTVFGTKNKSLVGQISLIKVLPKPDNSLEYNWGLAANAAQYVLLKSFFSTTSTENVQKIEALRLKFETELSKSSTAEVAARSSKLGTAIGEAIFDYSKTDNGHEAFKNNFPTYVLPQGLGAWVPIGSQKALLPNWPNNISLVKANETTNPPPPLTFSYNESSAFYKEAKEIYDISKTLTAEQKAIAVFWGDGGGTFTPPGHHTNIATIVLKQKNASLSLATETYVKIGLALNDAFIACWRCKYKYNLIRPVSYIHETIDKNWTPLLATPPFPEYTSGHSSGAGAAAEILKAQFGESTSFTDNSSTPKYPSRTFSNFSAYADESSNSRIYGGIHFRKGCEEGVKNGRKIAQNVLSLSFK